MTKIHLPAIPGNSKEIEASSSSRKCDFNIKNGAKPFESAGIARWGSAPGNAAHLDVTAQLYAFGIIKRYSCID
jgi:hypothetical protein